MSVKVKEYYGTPGLTYIQDSALQNVEIMQVSRNGMVHDFTGNEEPRNLQFIYGAPGGGIHFDPNNPFTGPTGGGRVNRQYLERIKVIYRV